MKIAIYARVSTEKQEKQETIKSQLEALREFAKKNNHSIYEEYIDEGYSGELLDRPALDKLRDDAKGKLFEAVLVHSPDRLSRKYIYSGLLQEELKKLGLSIIFLNRPDSKDTPEENLLSGVQGLIAEFEKAKITERTRRGRLYKAKNGFLVTSQAPYGYRYVRIDKISNAVGRYEMVEEEAKVVKTVFDLFVYKRLSIRSIARELTRRGIKPRQGRLWRTSSLHRVIRNETYTGITHYNKHVSVEAMKPKNGNKYRRTRKTSLRLKPKDQWIPIELSENLRIIDRRTFELAQSQLKRNSELSLRNTKYQYLLRGMVKCGKCESPFYGTPCHGKLFYRCGNRHRTFPLPRECNTSMVNAGDLETVVWDKFCEAIKSPRLITEQVSKINDRRVKSKTTVEDEIEKANKRLANMQEEENRLLEAYRQKIITIEKLKEQMAVVQERKKALGEEKQKLITEQENGISPSSVKKTIRGYCFQVEKRLSKLSNDFDGKRYLLSLAINKVILDGKNVRIKGIIPTYPQDSSSSGDIIPNRLDMALAGNTTSITLGHYGLRLPLPQALV